MIHEIRLTCRGANTTRDLQAAHALVYAMTPDATRRLWAQPTRDLIVIRADGITIDTEAVASCRTHADPTLAAGQRVTLTLIASPVRRDSGRAGERPATERAIPTDGLADWLAARIGDAATLHDVEWEQLTAAHGRKHGTHVAIPKVGFAATATIHNPDRIHQLMADGVGRGKAYGCGLLLVGES